MALATGGTRETAASRREGHRRWPPPTRSAPNRLNAQKSTGPKSTDVTRYSGLTHGLCAEHLVVPGESLEACEAERRGWTDDWGPLTHTRAVLVERAFVASWKLRRATRVEGTLMSEKAADVAHDFDEQRRVLVASATHNLPIDPAYSLSRFRSDVAGLDHLIGLWEELAAAVEGGWTSRTDHHDRLMNLLGHKAASAPADLEAARASTALLAGPAPAAAAVLRSLCAGRIADLQAERSQYCDLPEYRARLIDVAIAPTSKEAQLLHRYEREHEKALYAAIRGLLALEKSGADLPEPSPRRLRRPSRPRSTARNRMQVLIHQRLAPNWLRSGNGPRPRARRLARGGRSGRRDVPDARSGPIRGRRRPRPGP